MMPKEGLVTRTFIIGLQCLILSTAVSLYAQRGAPQAPRPDNAQSLEHINAAKKLAADDSFLANPNNFFCVAGNARAQNNNAPDLEPVKLFDNVYAVGNSETAVYALTSSEGIVLLDAGFENKAESVLVPQLQKLGLDPAKVKYILLGHGHADHFGGSKYFQDKYGTKIAATAADWDLINAPARGGRRSEPGQRCCACRGATVQIRRSHHHADRNSGAHARFARLHFPVKDKGQTRTAGLFGGTVLTTGILTTDALKQYTQSIAHYLDAAKKMNVDVELQNHPIFDGMPDKLAKLKSAKASDPNPFVIGNDRYLKMWNIVSECIQAEVARREGSN